MPSKQFFSIIKATSIIWATHPIKANLACAMLSPGARQTSGWAGRQRLVHPLFARLSILLAILLVALLGMTMAHADVNTEMNRFWNKLGATSNVTGPTAFKGQAAGYYTLGNIRTRSATRVSQLASFQLPSVEAGCGGIDVFSGAFSMMSKRELVQLSKAIAANAVGFAFDLALETLSPVIAETMQKLRDLQQKLNGANINSCETAQSLVMGAWPRSQHASTAICARIGANEGMFADYAASRHGCGTNDGYSNTRSNARETDDKKQWPENINITWDVLRGKRFISGDWLKTDKAMAEMMMSLAGTIIIKEGTGEAQAKVVHLPGLGYDRAMVDWYIAGGAAPKPLYVCLEQNKCLDISEKIMSIRSNRSLRGRVGRAIDGLITAIKQGDEPAPANGIKLVNRTSLPLYRILNVYAAYSGPIIDAERAGLVDAVAADLALQFLSDMIDEITNRAGSSEIIGQEIFTLWEADLHRLRREVRARQLEAQASYNKALELVERVRLIEAQLAGRFGDQFGKSIDWTTPGGDS